MRSLIVVAIICLASTPVFACTFDSDCKTGMMCVDGACSRDLLSGSDNDEAPAVGPTKGKTCSFDDDCDAGARCIKGSGPKGVCLGH